jgi:hypothetical protein
VVIDGTGVAIYVADITYRSEVVRLRIDLLAHSSTGVTVQPAPARDAAMAAAPLGE